jgi:hypothetical protein
MNRLSSFKVDKRIAEKKQESKGPFKIFIRIDIVYKP